MPTGALLFTQQVSALCSNGKLRGINRPLVDRPARSNGKLRGINSTLVDRPARSNGKLRGINRPLVDRPARSLKGLQHQLKVKGRGCLCGGEGVRGREKCCVDNRVYGTSCCTRT